MPSNAYSEFAKNLTDVRRLIAAHEKANAPNPGRRALGHFTRGGLLLLCAAWERYIETVVEEAARFLTTKLATVADLPPNAQQKTRDYTNSGKTPWFAADLNSATWKVIYLDALTKRTEKLNTPKHENLQPLFETFLDVADIGNAWTGGTNQIDDFVTHRGEVAHRGGQSAYVRIGRLSDAGETVSLCAKETDNFLSDHVRLLVTPHRRPWNRVQ